MFKKHTAVPYLQNGFQESTTTFSPISFMAKIDFTTPFKEKIKYIEHQLITLGHEKYKLKRDIPIKIEKHDNEDYVAWVYELNTFGAGLSIEQAINDLQENILSLYQDLKCEKEENLTHQVKKWKNILQDIICVDEDV